MCGINGIFAYHSASSAPGEAELLATRDAMRRAARTDQAPGGARTGVAASGIVGWRSSTFPTAPPSR